MYFKAYLQTGCPFDVNHAEIKSNQLRPQRNSYEPPQVYLGAVSKFLNAPQSFVESNSVEV